MQVPACVREVLREPPRAQVRRQLLTNFCTSFSQRFLQAHASHRSQAARDCLHHASLAGSEQVAESFGGVLFASPERQATSGWFNEFGGRHDLVAEVTKIDILRDPVGHDLGREEAQHHWLLQLLGFHIVVVTPPCYAKTNSHDVKCSHLHFLHRGQPAHV